MTNLQIYIIKIRKIHSFTSNIKRVTFNREFQAQKLINGLTFIKIVKTCI